MSSKPTVVADSQTKYCKFDRLDHRRRSRGIAVRTVVRAAWDGVYVGGRGRSVMMRVMRLWRGMDTVSIQLPMVE